MCSNSPCDQLVKKVQDLLENPETLRGDISPVISLLEEHVTPDGIVSPVEGEKLWKVFAGVVNKLIKQGFSRQAIIDLTVRLYHHICSLQLTYKRYHKGSLTHQAGIFYLGLGQRHIARWFFILAFIEDVLSGLQKADTCSRPLEAPAATTLRTSFNMPRSVQKSIEEIATVAYSPDNDLWYFPETIAVTLAKKELLPQPSHIGTEEIPLNHPLVQHLCDRLDEEGIGTNEKGDRLEDLAAYLLQTLPGARVLRNVKTSEHESDLIVVQQPPGSSYMLEALGRAFLVECKNWEKPVPADEVNHFVAKIRFHKCKCGILFATSSITGRPSQIFLERARVTLLRWFHQDGCSVLVVDKDDLQLLAKGTMSVGELLLDKHELLRFRSLVTRSERKQSNRPNSHSD
jgi:hypothetical protein